MCLLFVGKTTWIKPVSAAVRRNALCTWINLVFMCYFLIVGRKYWATIEPAHRQTAAPVLRRLNYKWGFWEVGPVISSPVKPERTVGVNWMYLWPAKVEIRKIKFKPWIIRVDKFAGLWKTRKGELKHCNITAAAYLHAGVFVSETFSRLQSAFRSYFWF